ncbi:MAG: acyl-ACP--UDP-N-acetylglucosamine O-acyltransferase [Planctomycetota bacterium]
MSVIHPTAIIETESPVPADIQIGAGCIVRGRVSFGSGCVVEPCAFIVGDCSIGDNCHFYNGAVIGQDPQLINPSEMTQDGKTVIGNNVIIREHVTVHRSLNASAETRIGDGCRIMAGAHVAYNCVLGNQVIAVNNALLAGFVTVGDGAFLSGGVVVHQYCRIGKLVMLQGQTAIAMHVPPFMLCSGLNKVVGINTVGMKQWQGLDRNDRQEIKEAYRLLYRSKLNVQDALRHLEESHRGPAVEELVAFVKAALNDAPPFRRGVCPG